MQRAPIEAAGLGPGFLANHRQVIAPGLLDLGVAANIVEKAGSWYSFDGNRVGQGRENAKTFLKENPDIAATIEARIRQNAGLLADHLEAGPDGEEVADPETGELKGAAS